MTHFPGGTSVTRLQVYADGGGTPHMHTVSTEAYVVIGGKGSLQTLDTSGFRETPLETGSTVWFTPGVIHRAVNHGDLQVVVVMSNAGLPEAGDAVMTFPSEILSDPDRYREAIALGPDPAASVHHRRALAVDGFQRLIDDPAALAEFYRLAAALVRPRIEQWRRIWSHTVEPETRRTAAMLDALGRGDFQHLNESGLRTADPAPGTAWGMCGHLQPLEGPS
ncbi:cupin domain-containing protein [Actinoplanes sp. G11-F43]|uniref:cupin domain-containing protein n=1 Tax=Actinoplanes sp. G11-F43 TaxID=3424130 RepID=UPI003D34E60B